MLRYPVSSEGFGELLDEMRMRAGLSVHEIARLWDVKPNALYQYFHKKRGRGGRGHCGGFCDLRRRVGVR